MADTIRIAKESDAYSIAEVVVLTWQVIYSGIISDKDLANFSVFEREKCWKKRLQGNDPQCLDWTTLVYEKERKIIGFATYRPSGDTDKNKDSVVELVAIYLLPGYWEQGLGKRLMDDVLGRAKTQGVSEVSLWVIEANSRARKFYERTGFHTDGAKKDQVILGTMVTEVRYVSGSLS